MVGGMFVYSLLFEIMVRYAHKMSIDWKFNTASNMLMSVVIVVNTISRDITTAGVGAISSLTTAVFCLIAAAHPKQDYGMLQFLLRLPLQGCKLL